MKTVKTETKPIVVCEANLGATPETWLGGGMSVIIFRKLYNKTKKKQFLQSNSNSLFLVLIKIRSQDMVHGFIFISF